MGQPQRPSSSLGEGVAGVDDESASNAKLAASCRDRKPTRLRTALTSCPLVTSRSVRAFTAAEPPPLAALAGFLGMESPLPEIARVFYTRGGCWNLALALRAATGFPIQLAYRDGVPVHAYVVIDDEALGVDAYGKSGPCRPRVRPSTSSGVCRRPSCSRGARAGRRRSGTTSRIVRRNASSVPRFASSRRPLMFASALPNRR